MIPLCGKQACRVSCSYRHTHSYPNTPLHTQPTPTAQCNTPTHPPCTSTQLCKLVNPLKRISTLSTLIPHYESIHTHTASHTHSASCLNPVTPCYIPATPLPASYTTLGSVYVHWPYCRQRCSYCNFVKFIPRSGTHWTLPHDVLEDAMVSEVQHSLRRSHITSVPSVFFGGGTPSLARPQMVEKVLRAIENEGHLQEGAEVTLEVNPTSLETQALRDFKEAGVNRVSIGVQTLDEATLRQLHRDHCVKEAKECLEKARSLFPGRTSIDLMFGLPNHSVERWEREVQEAVTLCDDHLSLYQLTVENGTALYKQVKAGEVRLPDQDQMADLYTVAVQVLQKAGLYRYEVSNFARCQNAESIHNKGYWQGQQYIGVGPGAHSRVVPRAWKSARSSASVRDGGTVIGNCETGTPSSVHNSARLADSGTSENSNHRSIKVAHHSDMSDSAITKSNSDTFSPEQAPGVEHKSGEERSYATMMGRQVIREARVNAADPASWLRETLNKGDGTRKTECQTRTVAAAEYLASGLRTREGVTAGRWSVFLPHMPLGEVFGGELGWLRDAGLVRVSPEELRATVEGLPVLDAILPHLYNILHHRLG